MTKQNAGDIFEPTLPARQPFLERFHAWAEFVTDLIKMFFVPSLLLGWWLVHAFAHQAKVPPPGFENAPFFVACSMIFLFFMFVGLFGLFAPSLQQLLAPKLDKVLPSGRPDEFAHLLPRWRMIGHRGAIAYLWEYLSIYFGAIFTTLAFVGITIFINEFYPSAKLDDAVAGPLTASDMMTGTVFLGWTVGAVVSGFMLRQRDRNAGGQRMRSVLRYAAYAFARSVSDWSWMMSLIMVLYALLLFAFPENRWTMAAVIIIPIALICFHALQSALAEAYSQRFLRVGGSVSAVVLMAVLVAVPGSATCGAWVLYFLDAGGGIPITALIRDQLEGSDKFVVRRVTGCLVLWVGNQLTIERPVVETAWAGLRCQRVPALNVLVEGVQVPAALVTVNRTDLVSVIEYGPPPK